MCTQYILQYVPVHSYSCNNAIQNTMYVVLMQCIMKHKDLLYYSQCKRGFFSRQKSKTALVHCILPFSGKKICLSFPRHAMFMQANLYVGKLHCWQWLEQKSQLSLNYVYVESEYISYCNVQTQSRSQNELSLVSQQCNQLVTQNILQSKCTQFSNLTFE